MPRIIVETDAVDDGVVLSERLVAANLQSPHYARQLLERLSWAAADAEVLESRSPVRRRLRADHLETAVRSSSGSLSVSAT